MSFFAGLDRMWDTLWPEMPETLIPPNGFPAGTVLCDSVTPSKVVWDGSEDIDE
jgi:hypothetical protein